MMKAWSDTGAIASKAELFFFTLALADRRSAALVDHVATLRVAFRTARHERPFAIDAIVILPDHLHAILTPPPADNDFPGRWRRIKGYFSTRLLETGVAIKRRSNGELALWQRRYWEHTIRDDDDYARHIDYIHYNPMKHGLVRRVRDWPHSFSPVRSPRHHAGRLGWQCC
jgi:putative transposase